MKRKHEIVVLSRGAFARTIRIYAPSHADRAIIMHDGQNVFYDDDATYKKSWRALDALKACGIKNTAIIGIDSTATRYADYLPFPTEIDEFGLSVKESCADVYCDYLEHTVLPYLDKRFGFKFYGMLGSSAGALITLYFSARKHTKLKAYGMYSTPLFVSPTAFTEFFTGATFDTDAFYQVYTGGAEIACAPKDPEVAAQVPQLFVDDAFTLTNALRDHGVKNLRLEMENTSVHDETCWRAPEKEFFKYFAELKV